MILRPFRFWKNPNGTFAVIPVVSLMVFLVLVIRLVLFVNHYAVDVLFWDQWDFYWPLFRGEGPWALFSWQHGPHRQGLGMLITAALANLSGWDCRWNSFAVCTAMIVSAILAIRLALRCGLGLGISTIFCSVLFLNLHQWEIFVFAPNISHGALPLVLLLSACHAVFVRNVWVRVSLIGLIAFFLIFTVFGLFGGLVLPVVLIGEIVTDWFDDQRSARLPNILALLFILGSWLLFLHGYVFSPAVPGFRFPCERPWEYVPFAGLMLSNAVGVSGHRFAPMLIGGVLLTILAAVCLVHLRRLFSNSQTEFRPRNQTIWTLSAFTLAFVANTAVGRICLGWEGADSSRYVPLIVPGFLSIFLCLRYLPSRFIGLSALAITAVCAAGMLNPNRRDQGDLNANLEGRRAWCRAYRDCRDPVVASKVSGYLVYPVPEDIRDRLEFLTAHHLSFLRSGGPRPHEPAISKPF